jgi:PIN like domain
MRILLDECVNRKLKRHLVGHKALTVQEMGWSGKTNGELLKLLLAEKFEVFLTVDQNLRYQQDLRAAKVAVVVLIAPTNRLPDLLPLVPELIQVLGSIKPGDLVEIGPIADPG